MSDRITAPWTEAEVAALNAFQRSGVMHPFTCGGEHDMHQTLVAEPDGWHCPDEECGYRQAWAWAFMAVPVTSGGLVVWPRHGEAPRTDPMAAELKRVRLQLRETEDQLAEARQRLEALRIHAAICRVEAAIPAPAGPVCGETLYERPILTAGSIDTWQEAAGA